MLPEDPVIEWIFETWRWLGRETDRIAPFLARRLLLPTPEDVPVPAVSGRPLVEALFEVVRGHAGLGHVPCELVLMAHGDPMRHVLANVPHQFTFGGAAGTITLEPRARAHRITVDEEQLDDPMRLVATLAHELAHVVVHQAGTPPPGGPEYVEPATDLCAVRLGFGVFQANSVFRFRQYTSGLMIGWSSSRQGYLGEVDLAYALAIFAALKDLKPRAVRRHLRANPRSYFRAALRDLKKRQGAALDSLRLPAVLRSS